MHTVLFSHPPPPPGQRHRRNHRRGSAASSLRIQICSIIRPAAFKLLKRFYIYKDAQGITRDITPGLVLPDVKQKLQDQHIEVFTEEELNAFQERIPLEHRLRLLVILGIETGARIAELLALTYDDIDGDSMTINKSLAEIDPLKIPGGEKEKTRAEISGTKTLNSIRSIPLTEEAQEAIRIHKKWHLAEQRKNGYTTHTMQLFNVTSTH